MKVRENSNQISFKVRRILKVRYSSQTLVKEIGRKVMEETGEKRSTFFLFQSISIALQRGNASCVLGTVPQTEGLEEIFDFMA